MARSVVIRQANGNQVRSAMVEFLMDGNLTVPDAWDVGFTLAVDDVDGTEVNAAEAINAATSGVTPNQDAIEALVVAINAGIDGVKAYWAKNSEFQYVVHVEAIPVIGQSVVVSSAVFAASS